MYKNSGSDFIDFRGLFNLYRKNWYLFVISLVVCGAVAFTYGKLRLREYAVKANVLIQQNDPLASGGGDAIGGAMTMLFGSDADVQDEVFIISSHTVYRDVARDLKLNISYKTKTNFLASRIDFPDHPLEVIPQAGMLDTLKTAISFKVKVNKKGLADIKGKIERSTVLDVEDMKLPCTVNTPLGDFIFAKTATYPEGESLRCNISVCGYDAAAEDLDEDVVAEIASKRSNVIALSMNTTNPDYGKTILNTIIDLYNKRGVDETRRQNEKTARFIDERLDKVAHELNVSEAEVQQYKQGNGIVDFALDAEYNIKKKGQLETEIIAARTSEEILRMTLDFINLPENAYALVPMSTDNPGLQSAIGAYNDVLLKRAELAGSAGKDNATYRNLTEQLDLMRKNIATSVAKALETASVTVRDLTREFDQASGSLSEMPRQQREFAMLARDLTVKREIFVFLLQRREETAVMIASANPKGQTVDEAFTLKKPLGLGRFAILLIGLIFGLMIPPIYLYIRKLVHNRFETREEVERITDVPILGEMCVDHSGNSLVVTADSVTSSAELFRLMRSNLLFILNDPKDKVVLLTSSQSGEGKSFIAINLAATLALLKKRVLLVGMDIRNPQLANYLNVHPKFGLTQYLASSSVTLDQIIVPDVMHSGVDLIVAGPVPPNPGELLTSNRVDDLFATLRGQYDYIIIDTAPVGMVSDTFTLDRIADASIYICRANYTSLNELQIVNDIYRKQRLKKLSIVVNGTAAKKTYGYGRKK